MMKKMPFILFVVCVVMGSIGCRKDMKEINDRPVSATVITPVNPVLSGVLGTGHAIPDTILLNAATAWQLSGTVYVDSADVLQCECGTVIKGIPGAIGGPPTALVITRGAKVIMPGTANCPIVLTSAATNPLPGDWGGLVILGNAPSNDLARVVIEGLPTSPAPPVNLTYGGTTGTNAADNSGLLTYVRIEYAGYELSLNNRISALTLGGVGSGTVINFVETFKSAFDGFHLYGGNVNPHHLVSVDSEDEMFETVNGYQGTLRYVLGLADTVRADVTISDGILSENTAGSSTASPVTKPVYRSVTIVGVSNQPKAVSTNLPPSGSGRYGRAVHLRKNTDFDIDSAIFIGFNFGVSLDSAGSPITATVTTPIKYRQNHSDWLNETVTHAYFNAGSPALISRYITESNGAVTSGSGFSLTTPGAFYNFAIGDGNVAASNLAQVGLPNPFNRTPAGLMASLVSSGTLIAGGGAFPNNVNWLTGSWPRLQ
jgi:hypothetical protein